MFKFIKGKGYEKFVKDGRESLWLVVFLFEVRGWGAFTVRASWSFENLNHLQIDHVKAIKGRLGFVIEAWRGDLRMGRPIRLNWYQQINDCFGKIVGRSSNGFLTENHKEDSLQRELVYLVMGRVSITNGFLPNNHPTETPTMRWKIWGPPSWLFMLPKPCW